jgi:hypothetical protein
MIQEVAQIDPEMPFPLRAEAERLVRDGVDSAATQYFGARDYATLFRSMARTRKQLQHRPYLARQADEVLTTYMKKLFGVAATGPIDVHRAEEIPPVVEVRASVIPGTASVEILNNTGRLLTVDLRGPKDYKATIKAASRDNPTLPSGEYVQLVYAGPGVSPWLGIISLDGHQYQQSFYIGPNHRIQ